MINILYQNFSSKICRNCLSFFIFNLVIGFFISLLFFPIIYYSDLLLSIEESSLYLKSNKDMMFLFLLLYVVILFFVIEFLMKRALESYLLHNNENFDKLKNRGLFTKYFWKRIFSIIFNETFPFKQI